MRSFAVLFLLLASCSTEPEVAAVALWEPVDAQFAGCQGACGAHSEGAHRGAIAQPGARVGQETYCPVSGAVFRIEERHPHRDVDGQRYYFCCDSCADYFEAHESEVLAARIN